MFYHSRVVAKQQYQKQSFRHHEQQHRKVSYKKNNLATSQKRVWKANIYTCFNITKRQLSELCILLTIDDLCAVQCFVKCLSNRTKPSRQKLYTSLFVLAYHYNATKVAYWLVLEHSSLLTITYDEIIELYQTFIKRSNKLIHTTTSQFLLTIYKIIIQGRPCDPLLVLSYCYFCSACYHNNLELVQLLTNTDKTNTVDPVQSPDTVKELLYGLLHVNPLRRCFTSTHFTFIYDESSCLVCLPMMLAILSNSISIVSLLCKLYQKYQTFPILHNEIRQACCFGYMDIVHELYHYQYSRYKFKDAFMLFVRTLVAESYRYYQYGVATLLCNLSTYYQRSLYSVDYRTHLPNYYEDSTLQYLQCPLPHMYQTGQLPSSIITQTLGIASLHFLCHPSVFYDINIYKNFTGRYTLIQSWDNIERIIQCLSSLNTSSDTIVILQDIVQRQIEVNLIPHLHSIPQLLPQWTGTVREWLKQIIPMMALDFCKLKL